MAGNFTPAPRVKNALDNKKLQLSAPVPGMQGKTSSLQWGMFAGNPRITVYTNDPNDQGEQNNNGKIAGNMDPVIFLSWLNELRKVIEAPGGPENKRCLDCMKGTWYQGRPGDPQVESKLWFGKDNEGVVWLSLVDAKKDNRPKIKFEICHHEFHMFRHADGRAFTKGEMSAAMVEGYFLLLSGMIPQMVIDAWPEIERKEEERKAKRAAEQGGGGGRGNWGGGGGNRGGGNWQGGGQGHRGGGGGAGGYGGGQRQEEPVDGDSIPF